jgi:hypothetical protein
MHVPARACGASRLYRDFSQPRHRHFNVRHSTYTPYPSIFPSSDCNHGQLPRLHLRYRAGQGQLLLLLQNRRLPSRRPLLAQTRQALVQPDHPAPEPVPEPGVRPEEQDEPAADADALRRLLRGYLVRAVPVRIGRGAGGVRQQQ